MLPPPRAPERRDRELRAEERPFEVRVEHRSIVSSVCCSNSS